MSLERRSRWRRMEHALRTAFLWIAVPVSLLILAWWFDPRGPLTERLLSSETVTVQAGGSFTVRRELCSAGLVNEHRQLLGNLKVTLLPSYTVDGAGGCRMTLAEVSVPPDLPPGDYAYQVLGEVPIPLNPLVTYARAFTTIHIHVEPAAVPVGANAAFMRRLAEEIAALRRRIGRLNEQMEFLEARARRLMLDSHGRAAPP